MSFQPTDWLNAHHNPWLEATRLVPELTLEYRFIASEGRFRPDTPRDGDWVLSRDIVGREQAFIRHYRDVIQRHGARAAEHHFWNRPALIADEINVSFAWCDRFRETHSTLEALSAAKPGVVFSNLDQGWALDMVIQDGFLYIWDRNWESRKTHHLIRAPIEAIQAQALELLPRVQRLIQTFSAALGHDHWT